MHPLAALPIVASALVSCSRATRSPSTTGPFVLAQQPSPATWTSNSSSPDALQGPRRSFLDPRATGCAAGESVCGVGCMPGDANCCATGSYCTSGLQCFVIDGAQGCCPSSGCGAAGHTVSADPAHSTAASGSNDTSSSSTGSTHGKKKVVIVAAILPVALILPLLAWWWRRRRARLRAQAKAVGAKGGGTQAGAGAAVVTDGEKEKVRRSSPASSTPILSPSISPFSATPSSQFYTPPRANSYDCHNQQPLPGHFGPTPPLPAAAQAQAGGTNTLVAETTVMPEHTYPIQLWEADRFSPAGPQPPPSMEALRNTGQVLRPPVRASTFPELMQASTPAPPAQGWQPAPHHSQTLSWGSSVSSQSRSHSSLAEPDTYEEFRPQK